LEVPEEGDYEVKVRHSYMQPIDANRNKMVKQFLSDEDNDWLLMIDDDVVPPKDIIKMVEHGKPVVSATVTIKKGAVPQPVILKEQGDQYRQISMGEYVDGEADGLIEVDGVGTGCLLIRRDVLENMQPPWFKFLYNEEDGTLQLGEDFYFSRRLSEQGVPLHVSTDHVCSHFKKTDLTEVANVVAEYQQRLRELKTKLEEAEVEFDDELSTPDFPEEQ